MMNKKAVSSITGLVISILLVMGLFYGIFNYVDYNYENADVNEILGLNESYEDLRTSEARLESTVSNITSALQGVSEADSTTALVAWNGLTGLAYTLRLFIDIAVVGVNTFNAVFPALLFLPPWIKLLVELAIIVTIILLIVGAFKGESKT